MADFPPKTRSIPHAAIAAAGLEPAQVEETIERIARRTMMMDFAWDWPAGVAHYGMVRAWGATGRTEYLDYLKAWTAERMDRGLPRFTVNAVSLGHTLLDLHGATGDDRYLVVAREMAEFLARDAIRFGEGVLQHTVSQNYSFPEQAWADTLFMAALFLLKLGVKTGHQPYIDDALNQYFWHEEFLQDPATNLCFHAWDNLGRNHLSGVFWGRANAWVALTFAEALRQIGVTNPAFMRIADALRDQLAALVRCQTANGLWRTVLDDESAYEEISASAGIAAALVVQGRVFGYDLYDRAIARALTGVLANIAEDGTVRNVSAGTAVMPDAAAYRAVPRKRIQGWGQGLTLAFLSSLIESP
jgi:unsaturated rhamnogalacturonyl hydrolase